MKNVFSRISPVLAFATVSCVLLIGAGIAQADTAPAYDAGLSQVTTGATPITSFEKQALACRNSATAQALLTVGALTPADRQALGLGTSAANDWCVFLKAHLDNVPSQVEGLNPGFGQCLMKFIEAGEASGSMIRIYSGYRSVAYQAQLYAAALKKYGSASVARQWVAPPGNSMHNKGLAADLSFNGSTGIVSTACASNTACVWAHANAAAFGLNFRLANEAWHIEPLGSACQTVGSAPTSVASAVQSAVTTSATPNVAVTIPANASAATTQSLITSALSGTQPIATGAYSGIQASGVLGNLFNSFIGSVASTSGLSSTLKNTIGLGTLLGNISSGIQTGTPTQNLTGTPTDYLVISEDGVLLGESTVSAQDALAKASAFYNANVMATSSQAHVSDTDTGAMSSTLGTPYQLSDGTNVYVTSNTFPTSATGAFSATGTVQTGMQGFVQTLIQGIFGTLGALFARAL